MTLLAQLAATSGRVSETASRRAKIAELAACLRGLVPDEIPIAIAFLSGETRQGRLGVSCAALRAEDWGAPPSSPTLSVMEADAAFTDLAAASGKGSAALRAERLATLFKRTTEAERDFLGRLIVGELRQGALQGLMVEAIAAAAGLPLAEVRRAAMSAGGLGEVARAVLTEGAGGLARFPIRLLQPVLPMLSQSADGTDEALATLGTAALEWKLDGARVQVHKAGDEVRCYTRNLNEMSARVPEIVEAVRVLPAASLILDGEAIALKPDGSPHSFQVTMRRFGRKLEVEALRRELPLSVFFFDCLLRDGDSLADRPASERFRALQEALRVHPFPVLLSEFLTPPELSAGSRKEVVPVNRLRSYW